MQYLVGALIVVFGIAMAIAGATGSGANLFGAVTGKTPGAAGATTSDQVTQAALAALTSGSGTAGGGSSSPPPLSSLPGVTV